MPEKTIEVSKMKGFIPIGNDSHINIDYIDLVRTHYEPNIKKVVLFDIYGTKFYVPPQIVKGRIRVNGLE